MELNIDVSRVNSFANRKSISVDTTWKTYERKTIFNRVISTIKGEADNLLNIDQVDNFSFIHKKAEIINLNTNRILYKLIKIGTVNEKDIDYDLLNEYFNKGLISIEDLKNSIINFFRSELNYIYNKTSSPLIGDGLGGETIITQHYHDLDHDLLKCEQLILAYGIKNNLLNQSKINILEIISKKGGDTLEEFCNNYYDEKLLEKYLEKNGITSI